MSAQDPADAPPVASALPANVLHFARVLRRAGLPIGPGQVLTALEALGRVRIADRDEFYWALHAVLVSDPRQHDIFDQAFRLFWRDPDAGSGSMLDAVIEVAALERKPTVSRRVAEALQAKLGRPRQQPAEERVELDAAMTYSVEEQLRSKDFAQMSADELRHARQLMARMRLPVAEVPTRRFRPDARGSRVDLRTTLRASARAGAGQIPLRWRTMRTRPPALVALCDISGSMERYSHILLHFLHALTSHRERVHSFVFGTRLTNVTRYLRQRDIDVALARIGSVVQDWSSGTRIGVCLEDFNLRWSRRVLGQGAVVLLISDGLDRDAGEGLARQMERLHKSCRRLIWLNPLLRYAAFEPRALGIQAMLPHVDDFRPVHNLTSLAELADALSQPRDRRGPRVPQARRSA